MNALGGDRIGRFEEPPGEYRLYDFEPLRDPCNAFKKSIVVHVGVGCPHKLEHDFRLDAGLGKTGNVKRARQREMVDRPIVKITPDWRRQTMPTPDGAVCEPNLATEDYLSIGHANIAGAFRNLVGVLETEVGKAA